MAYTLDLKGDEVYKLYIRNVTWAGGKAVKAQTVGPINNVAGGDVVWANDNTTFFCVTQVCPCVSLCDPKCFGDPFYAIQFAAGT